MSKIERRGIFLSFLILLSSFQVFGQEDSTKFDRAKKALVGPVAKIKFESTYFKREGEKWVESERHWQAEWEFDRAGKIINIKANDTFGDPRTCEEKYKYDKRGRETVKFCMEGAKEVVLEKYSYEEDRHGNWTKQVASRPDGSTFHIQWIMYREITYFK